MPVLSILAASPLYYSLK